MTAAESNIATKRTLISPGVDILMIGGASLIFLILAYYTTDKQASIATVSLFAFYLSFVVNFPHFLLSYQLLYFDNKKRLLCEKKIFWAAFIAPTILIALLGYSIAIAQKSYLGYMVETMFILVGWHYVKQVYGTIIITAVIAEIYFNTLEKFALRFNMYALWIFTWTLSQTGTTQNMFGISYQTFNLPTWSKIAVSFILAISFIAVIFLSIKKYIHEGKTPPAASMVAFLSIYAWFIPTLYHPVFFYMIPFFHSLQYLLFVIPLRKNKVQAQNQNLSGPEYRLKYTTGFIGYMFLSVVLGAAFFYLIPTALDYYFRVHTEQLGPQIFLFAFYIFINIHHYFIDNAIWTNDNKEIGEHLIRAR